MTSKQKCCDKNATFFFLLNWREDITKIFCGEIRFENDFRGEIKSLKDQNDFFGHFLPRAKELALLGNCFFVLYWAYFQI